MSWHYSQVLAAEYLGVNSLGGEPSAPSKENPTHGMCWSFGKMMAASNPSRSGMMYAPLMESHGEALLISYLEAFRAKTLASQERGKESTGSALACGAKWHESFVKWDPDSSSWKTRQCSLLEGLDGFSETWPAWGSMLNGECWQRDTPAHLTYENESGFWPTLAKMDSQNCHPHQAEISNGNRLKTISSKGKRGSSPLRSWLAAFPDRPCKGKAQWASEPAVGRMVHGVADGMDRIAALGNGQIPAVVRLAWRQLFSQMNDQALPPEGAE